MSGFVGRGPARVVTLSLLLVFFLTASLYNLTNPAFESPDEVGHFIFIQELVTTRSLPRLRLGAPGEAHQPPLYYVLAALAALPADFGDATGALRANPQFMWAGQGGTQVNIAQHGTAETFPFRGQALALHLARESSVLMGLATVLITLALGRRLLPDRPEIAWLAAALVAFVPQFLFISGSVNNDNLAILLASAGFLQMARLLERPDRMRDWVVLGVLVALGVLTKLSGAVVALLAAVLVVAQAVQRRSPRLLGAGLFSIGVPGLALTGWWFVRNQLLYGDLMGWELYKQVFAANLRSGPLTFLDLQQMFTTQYRSFLGVFGWMNLPVPTWYYRAAGILVIAGLAGLAVYLARGKWHGLSRVQQATLLGMACTVIAQEVYILATVTQCNASCYQGRYMFPVIAPLMLLLAFGLLSLVPRPQARVLAGVLTLALAAAAVYMPLRVIAPAYAGVPEAKTSLWLMPHKMNVMFGDQIRLRGYDARIEGNGATVRLTLYWEAARKPDFNYSAFAHLLDASGQVIDQQDHAPGEDRGYPPGAWLPEDIVADTHTLSLPAGSDANGYQFRVGLYNWSTGQQLAVTSPQPAASFVILRL